MHPRSGGRCRVLLWVLACALGLVALAVARPFGLLLPVLVPAIVATAIFAVLERRWPGVRGLRWRRAGYATDVKFWVFGNLLTKPAAGLASLLGLLLAGIILRAPIDPDGLRGLTHRDTLLGVQPAILQLLEVVLLSDFISYWAHRQFHFRPALWRYHAIHHSSTELDWLSSVRVHPINDVAMHLATVPFIVIVGFDIQAVGGLVGLLGILGTIQHANLSWTFGRFGYVIASPVFHRWHHTSESEGLDTNFAGMLPLLDLVFGTFYMPARELPGNFGVSKGNLPDSLSGQLTYPFRRRPA
jgi:sterol desaturase/sphingolipid hydroxylase (fatty acid hydroxylase superfamily)